MATRPTARLAGVLLCASLFATGAGAQAPSQKRMSWEEFSKDPARVASFREAVRVMKSRNTADPKSAGYRTSWQYWAAIHGYLGPGAGAGTVQEYIEWDKSHGWWRPGDEKYFAGITDLTPPDATAKAVWDQCEHGSPNFFLWHRLFLMQFEKVLRAAAKDNTLRLPYWDYTDPAHGTLPAEFRTATYVNAQGQTVDNPLYELRRDPDWSTKPATALDPQMTDIDGTLEDKDFAQFQSDIEGGVHSGVHCAMNRCPAPAMGAVAWSANDPIFLLHHTNIDRMLSCWTSDKTHKIKATAKSYSFVDEQGKLVKVSTQPLISGKGIDYAYDKQVDCARGDAADNIALVAASPGSKVASGAAAPAASPQGPAVLGTAKNVQVRGDSATATLPLSSTPLAPAGADATGKSAPGAGRRTELVLRGVQADHHPGVVYKVFISAPGAAQKEYVGTLGFFAHAPAAHHQHAGVDRTLDITRAAKRLGPSADLTKLEVTFEAATGRAGDARAQANPQATVSIREMTVRTR